jgi:hypothetical protein
MAADLELPKFIFGLHDPGGEFLMAEKGKPGWVVFTHELGRDPAHMSGYDHRPWSNRGFGIIARLNNGYGSAGTIPQPQYYDAFARRVRNFVQNSQGCRIWVVGNEMNHAQERPEGQMITPDRYAACYQKCWEQIHGLASHQTDQVAVGAVAPWNNTTPYPGNESGDWIRYFQDIIQAIRSLGCAIDALALHSYTHGSDPNLVFSEQRMSPPFQKYHYQFRTYQDFMNAIPLDLCHLPVYLTETDQDEPWASANRGWVQNVYQEINRWNAAPGSQQIRALALYRWPRFDKWYIEGKAGVHDDFRAAMNHDYVWQEMKAPRRINGHVVQGAFLDFFDKVGQSMCGLPISDEITENKLRTQYFERLALQQESSGQVTLKPVGTEVLALRRTVYDCQTRIAALQSQVQALQNELSKLRPPPAGDGEEEPTGQIVQPAWEDLVYQLPRHPTKRYATRGLTDMRYIVISHSAAPGTVRAQLIAQYHVEQLQWPGIGYHFYIDGQGRIFKTNELTTISYHAGEQDPWSIGICVGGDFTTAVPGQEQIQSLAHLVAWLLQELGLPLKAVKGKQELVDTQSPGYQWLHGQRWKDMLLAEIDRVRALAARS